MQTRLIACVVGALGGVSLTPVVGGFGLSSPLNFMACSFTGLVLGCFVSLLFDVFRDKHGA